MILLGKHVVVVSSKDPRLLNLSGTCVYEKPVVRRSNCENMIVIRSGDRYRILSDCVIQTSNGCVVLNKRVSLLKSHRCTVLS